MQRKEFSQRSARALEHLDDCLGGLEHESLDVNLAGDVLTLGFAEGPDYIVNAHSAAGQIWLAAGREAWHFDFDDDSSTWIAKRQGDELLETLARLVSQRLGETITIDPQAA